MKSLGTRVCTLVLLNTVAAIPSFAQSPSPAPREEAWGILKAGVEEKNTDKRTAAVRALGLIPRDAQALAMAEDALRNEKPEIRSTAASALGQMESTQCIPQLKVALADPDPSVVLAAAHALWTLKDPAAFEVYYAVLTGERKTQEGMVSEGMKTLRDPKKAALFGFEEGIGFIPFAGLGYSAVKALKKDDVSPVRAAAATILANDPDPQSGAALTKAVSDKSWVVRAAALDAIGKRGDPKLLGEIVPAMSDERDTVKYTAAAVVIRLGDIREPAKKPKKVLPMSGKNRKAREKN